MTGYTLIWIDIGIHPLVKTIIEKHELYYLRPKQVISSLRDREKVPEKYMPTKNQLSVYNCNLRKKLVEKYLKNNLESLENFVKDHSIQKAQNDEDLICLNSSLDPKDFLLTISSKKLSQNVVRQQEAEEKGFFFLDATYKILTNGFSLLTIGTENKSHNFHLIAYGITAHEDASSYKRFLTQITEALKNAFGFDWKPVWAVSDAAESISSALGSVFPNLDHIRCFFHVVKAVRDKIWRYNDATQKTLLKKDWGLLNYDVKLLHRTLTDDDFTQLWDLMKLSWQGRGYGKAFVDYFEKNYIKNVNKLRWNRLDRTGYNLTNNSLERFHQDLKATYTQQKKLKLNEFLVKSLKITRDFSVDQQGDFLRPITPSTECWRSAITYLNDRIRGPIYDIRIDSALFVKKKREIEKLDRRKQ